MVTSDLDERHPKAGPRAGRVRSKTKLRSTDQLPSTARERVVVVARELFIAHGVAGTSMQMIADTLGVTKGAVFYHFNTKADLVAASASVELDGLEVALDEAEATASLHEARETLLRYVIDRAVVRRRETQSLQTDLTMLRILDEQGRFRSLTRRFHRLFFDIDTPAGRTAAAALTAVIGQTVTNPIVEDLGDEELREQLLQLARRLLP